MRIIVLAGGGSAGHVLPLLTVGQEMQSRGWHALYLGPGRRLERELVLSAGLPHSEVPAGKLHRRWDSSNLLAPFVVLAGVLVAFWRLPRRTGVVLSTGGYASVPVVLAAWLRRIPIVSFECDLTPGLAYRLVRPIVTRTARAFAGSSSDSGTAIGPILRPEVATPAHSSPADGNRRPLLLVSGGSQGAGSINEAVRAALPKLSARYDVHHICGSGKTLPEFADIPGYTQYEYAPHYPELLREASLAVCRAGSSSLWELVYARVPHVAIPLSLRVSRGDQIANAAYFCERGCTHTLPDDRLSSDTLLAAIAHVEVHRAEFLAAMDRLSARNGLQTICEILEATASASRGMSD